MRAITIHRDGAPDKVLHVEEIDEPEVADDAVLVEVHATSINPADWHIIRAAPALARLQFGLRKPSFRVPGCAVAGRVVAVGTAVTTVIPGDQVFASSFMHGFGAEVTGVCSTSNTDLVRSLGAADVIDYTTTDVPTEPTAAT